MKLFRSMLPLVAVAAFASSAHATQCYSMFDGRNTLVYQSSTAPVDLSGSVSDAMRRRHPSRYLVIGDSGSCREIGTGPATAATLRSSGSLALDAPNDALSSSGFATMSDPAQGPALRDRPVRSGTRGDGATVQSYQRSAPGSRR